jgi:hypothetical protein
MRSWAKRSFATALCALVLAACGLADTEAHGDLPANERNPRPPVSTTVTTAPPLPTTSAASTTALPATPPPTTPPSPTTTTPAVEPPHPPPGDGPEVERYWVRYRALQRLSHTFRSTPVLPPMPDYCKAFVELIVHGYHDAVQRSKMTAPEARAALQQWIDDLDGLLIVSPGELRQTVQAGVRDAQATLAALPADAPASAVLAAFDAVKARQATGSLASQAHAESSCPSWGDYMDRVAGFDELGVTPQ